MSNALIDAASQLLDEKYNPPVHSVAAALLTDDGEIITALNIDHFSGFVCAETAALTVAINRGIYGFSRIVAVRKNERNEIAIANMCGKCRQIFHDYSPDIEVISYDYSNERQAIKKIDELLPYAFTRQQEKISALLEGYKK